MATLIGKKWMDDKLMKTIFFVSPNRPKIVPLIINEGVYFSPSLRRPSQQCARCHRQDDLYDCFHGYSHW